jgi:hypothetical protein
LQVLLFIEVKGRVGGNAHGQGLAQQVFRGPGKKGGLRVFHPIERHRQREGVAPGEALRKREIQKIIAGSQRLHSALHLQRNLTSHRTRYKYWGNSTQGAK